MGVWVWEDEGVRSWCVGVYIVRYVWKHDIYIHVALTYRVGISSGTLAVVNQNSSHIMVSSYVESIAVNNGSDVMTFENCTMQLSLWTESHYCTPKPRMAAIDVTAMYGSVIKKVNPFSCSPEWLLWQLNLPDAGTSHSHTGPGASRDHTSDLPSSPEDCSDARRPF